jgi:hypothetical protein
VAPPVAEALYGTDVLDASGPVSPVETVQVPELLFELLLQEKVAAMINDMHVIRMIFDFIIQVLIIDTGLAAQW